MPHPEIRNHTGLAYQIALLADEEGTPLLVPVLQATFQITANGSLQLLEVQPEVDMAGKAWGEPGLSSWRIEPQVAFFKPACDIILIGHAIAPRAGTTQMDVSFRVGSVQRIARVFGDRWLTRGDRISKPAPFERIELRYERAFGGWDRRDPDPSRHRFDSRNDVGLGYRSPELATDNEVRLPNIEDPDCLIGKYGDAPAPVGFGFVSPQWQPRLALAGTYDQAWAESRMPLLPTDFDRRFFNAASAQLRSDTPLSGADSVSVVGATATGHLEFKLPDFGLPSFNVILRGRRHRAVKMMLDTVIVDTDEMLLKLVWRANLPTRNGLHDVIDAAFHLPDPRARRYLRSH